MKIAEAEWRERGERRGSEEEEKSEMCWNICFNLNTCKRRERESEWTITGVTWSKGGAIFKRHYHCITSSVHAMGTQKKKKTTRNPLVTFIHWRQCGCVEEEVNVLSVPRSFQDHWHSVSLYCMRACEREREREELQSTLRSKVALFFQVISGSRTLHSCVCVSHVFSHHCNLPLLISFFSCHICMLRRWRRRRRRVWVSER